MKPEKAIEVLETENKHPWNRDNSQLRKAVQLGIEALRREMNWRISPDCTYIVPLPGETKE